MKINKKQSLIAVIVTAVIAIVCSVFAFTANTRKTNSGDFNSSYNLTAYADSRITQIDVFGRTVDVLKIDPLTSTDGNYQLYITVIDTADLTGLDVSLGYGFGEKVFSNIENDGLTKLVYSSLTSGEEKLTIDEVVEGFDLKNNGFDRPFFAIVEVAKSSILDKIGELVFAEKHTVELVEGKAATCTEDGYKAYYTCTNEECAKNFADKYAIKEITDLDVWKAGDGKIEATGHTEVTDNAVEASCTESGLTEGKHCSVCEEVLVAQMVVEATGHTEVVDEAVEATCTQSGLTEGKHCSVCNTVLVAQETVKANGHTYLDNYEDEYCTVCHDHKTVVKDVNGVNYTLNYNINSETGAISRYFIATGKAPEFNLLYTGEGAKTLILENAIDGISVTEIAASAFVNTDDEESTAIKSVIVPKNIKTVGEKAFQNNYGIERVVFLAESVHLNGSGSDASSTYPFYGCSTYKSDDKVDGKKGNEITKLNIYYHAITAKNSSDWKLFRYVYNGWWYSFHIQDDGGALYSSGWDYVTASATVDLNGVTGSTLTEEAANTILAKYYPLVSASSFVISDSIEASLKVDFAQYNINRNGVTYKCEFTPVLSKVGGYTHVTYSVSYTAAAMVNVHSGVAFTYHGMPVAANTTTEVMASVENDKVKLDVPSLDGYTFLGFAYADGTALTFGNGEDIAIAGKTVYVIWGHSKTATTKFTADVNTSGSELAAPVSNSIDGKWYDNNWNEVTSISLNNLVVYTRTKFTVTVSLNRGGYDTNRVFILKGSNQILDKKVSGHGLPGNKTTDVTTIDIYEGNVTFTITDKELTITTDKVTYKIYVKEIDWKGKDANKRDIKFYSDSEVNADTKEIKGNVTLVLGY